MAEVINRGNGKYLVRIFLGRDNNGRVKYINKTIVGNKKDALAWARDQETKRDLGTMLHPSKLTLNAFLDDWLATHVRPNVRRATHEGYGFLLDKHIRPALGEMPLQQIEAEHIQNVYNLMLSRSLSARYVRHIHTVLSSALRFAAERHLVAFNVAQMTKLPPSNQRRIDVFSETQAKAFLEAARADYYYAAFAFALSTGARPGEYLAMEWKDVDLSNRTARIDKTLRFGQNGAWYEIVPAKTPSSIRIVSFPPPVAAALKNFHTTLLTRRLRNPHYQTKHDFVFPAEAGQPLRLATLTNHHLRPTLKMAGLKTSYHLYCLRHTFATLALARKVDIKTVSVMLGHKSVAFTMDVYCKMLPSMEQAAIDTIEDALFTDESHTLVTQSVLHCL